MDSGRVEEAVTLLRAGDPPHLSELAEILVTQGRAAEALAVLPTLAEERAAQRTGTPVATDENGYAIEPPV
ncbi:hypothetical protein [Kitasatospora sp. NPDC088346]|uniref:hypothetical protein n=1 Tax=Kitasatospora sp. NPDC088346 TaxID=3364073 RepID=UPI0038110BCA